MDIISLPIELDKKKIDGRYRLVIAAVKRAKELSKGAMPLTQSKAKKVTTRALEEVLLEKLEILTGEEAIKAIEEEKRLSFKRLLEEKHKEIAAEDLTELEKDLKVYLAERGERDSKKIIEEVFGEETG
ncbi:MAG: DNA-directed RNA polymerase subunit omega [Thermodesulfovibrionia bacterium]